LAALVALAASACSSEASTRTDAAADPATTAPQVTLAAGVPPGTTIRVGDQLDYLKTILRLSGQDQNFPYAVDYSAFIGGPPMLQAFQAGAIDAGFIASTPLIFVQAGGQSIVAVAGWSPEHGSFGLVTAPNVTDIHGWKDLKGRKVAYQEGTLGESALLEGLDHAGLKLSDVTPVKVPQTQVTSTLQGGAADAGVSAEPLTTAYLNTNPGAQVVDTSPELTDRATFFITTRDSLGDPAKEAAFTDYVARLVRGFKYVQAHPDLLANYDAQTYHVTPDQANKLVANAGRTTFFPLPGDIVAPQQKLADLYLANGEIPAHIDVGEEFDGRFNTLVQQEQGS
jgi:sulfonate transport system substrate-binding protein